MSKVKHSRHVVEVRFKSQQPTLELAPSLQHRSSHLRRSHLLQQIFPSSFYLYGFKNPNIQFFIF